MTTAVIPGPEGILSFCNRSVAQLGYTLLDSKDSAHGDSDTPVLPSSKPSDAEIWGLGLLAVTIISSCAALGILLMLFLSRRIYDRALSFLVGLGVGSLSGSAIFHLLPHAFELGHGDHGEEEGHDEGEEEEDGHGFMKKAWMVIFGIYLFFFLDKFLQILMILLDEGSKKIATVAWMIIFGDALHNFIDGLSIGAGFSTSILSGVSVSVAILCEEFPHELGDVAILINAGMSKKQALMYNLMSAATCYVGFIIGVVVGELEGASLYIFALAGGMFLYISLASMIPEMTAAVEKDMEKSLGRGMLTLLLQAAGILTGLVALYLISNYEESISFE